MKKIVALSILAIAFAAPVAYSADAPMQVLQEIRTGKAPVDLTTSRSGQWVYVLTQGGTLAVYSVSGSLKDQIPVGGDVHRIEAGPQEDMVYLVGTQGVRLVRIELVHTFDFTGSPTKGPEDAPVTITVFTDFQCPYCARLAKELDRVEKAFPKQVRVIYKNFPLRNHPHAQMAAAAALAAHKKGKFWEFHDRLFAIYDKITPEKIFEIAQSLGFDPKSFSAQMSEPQVQELIQRDINEGREAGIRGTPTVFVNGRQFQDRSFEGFAKEIQELTAKK